MRNVTPMKTAKTGYIVTSIVLFLFGLLIVIDPAEYGVAMGIVVGVAMIIFGIFKIIGYFSKDLFRLAFQYDLAFGLLLISLGVIILIRPGNIVNFMSIAIGIAVLADALFKIQISMDARKFGISRWWLILSLAILTGLVGLLLVFNPVGSGEVIIRLLGVCLMAEGIMSAITVVTSVKIVNHQLPDMDDGEMRYREI